MIGRTRSFVSAAVAVGAAALPAAASAAWSPVTRLPASTGAGNPVVAVNARGDVAVGWLRTTTGARATTAIHVAVRRGPSGRFATRTLRHGRIAIAGLTLALDDRGELTVAWAQRGSIGGRLTGPVAVRAAFRTAGGRWSVARRVSTVMPFAYAQPQLAVRPDRSVVVVFNAGIPSATGAAYAWRAHGRIFGAVRRLTMGPRPRGYLFDLRAGADAAGRAYIAGVRGVDSGRSAGVLAVARATSRRFAAPRILAGPPARDLHLAVDPAGGAQLAWLGASFSTSEDDPGPVQALRAGPDGRGLGAVQTVFSSPSFGVTLSGGPGGAGVAAEIGWTDVNAAADGLVRIARAGASGAFGPPLAPPDGWVAVAADAAGDQVVEDLPPFSGGFATRAAVRLADGTVAVSPLRPRFVTAVATAQRRGRGAAVATSTASGLRVTDWRP